MNFVNGIRDKVSERSRLFPTEAFLGQYRTILSADTASEVRQMPSQKRTAHPIQGVAMRLLLFIAFLMENNIIVLYY